MEFLDEESFTSSDDDYEDEIEDDDDSTYLEDNEVIVELKREFMRNTIATQHNCEKKDERNKYEPKEMMSSSEVANLLRNLRLANNESTDNNAATAPIANIDSSKPFSDVEKKDDDSNVDTEHPQKTLQKILHLNGYETDPISFECIPKNFYIQMTDDNMKDYSTELLKAVRSEDMEAMEIFLKEGKNLQCCNRFGESIISVACRNRSVKILDFLVNRAKVSIKICDDYGRTPLHDACWVTDPDFKLIEILVQQCPDLFIVSDKRGHTPLSYTRKEHHAQWSSFLWENKDMIRPSVLANKIDSRLK